MFWSELDMFHLGKPSKIISQNIFATSNCNKSTYRYKFKLKIYGTKSFSVVMTLSISYLLVMRYERRIVLITIPNIDAHTALVLAGE